MVDYLLSIATADQLRKVLVEKPMKQQRLGKKNIQVMHLICKKNKEKGLKRPASMKLTEL